MICYSAFRPKSHWRLNTTPLASRINRPSFHRYFANMSEPSPKRQKLHGRAFYESIGSPKLVLAPMVDQSEYAWRLLSRSFFPPEKRQGLLAYSPMLHARMFAEGWKYRDSHFECRKEGWESVQTHSKGTGFSAADEASKHEMVADYLDGNIESDRPLFVQFCANDPQALLSAARLVQPFCDAVDLNLGCPQGIAKRGHYGAFLQEDQPLIAKMIRTLHENLEIPVTAKMRILETKEQTLEYAKTLLDAGASILTVHGRRREMKGHATGLADWNMIRFLRDNLPAETVLFANGNILQHHDIQDCLEQTGVDGVMSAEGNLYDPSIFAGAPPPDASGWVDAERECWRGRNGKGGYRVDAVLRRYLDIIHKHALGREPPARKPLFVCSDLSEEDRQTTDYEKVDGEKAVHSIKRQRSRDDGLSSGETDVNGRCAGSGNDSHHPENGTIKRQKTSSANGDQASGQTAPLLPPANLGDNSTSESLLTVKLSKRQRKAAEKKAAKLAPASSQPKSALEKPNSPNIVAMQAHCFHILRPLVSVHHNVRDALARSRAGDITAYEHVLTLTEAAVRHGLLAYERDPSEFEDNEIEEEERDVTESSMAAARRCKRPFWICQAYVRPLPHEALEKGSLQLSKKEIKKLEMLQAGATGEGKDAFAEVNIDAVRAGVAPEGRLAALQAGDDRNGRVLVEAEEVIGTSNRPVSKVVIHHLKIHSLAEALPTRARRNETAISAPNSSVTMDVATEHYSNDDGVAEGDGLGVTSHDNADPAPSEERHSADEGNKFQQAIAIWRTLNLTGLVRSLDTSAEELVAHQKDSLVQRKELAQKTKEFRKLDDAGKLGEIKDLLKSYQTYIDALTSQSKSVQSAFMQAYSPLSEAPDPYPLLEASIDSLITADEVMPRLEQENEHLKKQVSKLESQVEDTEKQLEEERSKRQSFEGGQEDRIKEVEESWREVVREKEGNWEAKEKSLESKVDNQERLLKELKASYEVSQRLDRSGEEPVDVGSNTASAVELEIVNADLEKANMRLAELQSRNEQLRVELAQSVGSQAHRNAAVEDDPSYLRLRSENTTLIRKLESARYQKDNEMSAVDGKMRALDREMTSFKTERDNLQARVQKWSDYDELKRELEMLRAIELASGSDDLDNPSSIGDMSATSSDSLEQLLLTRNKKISNELTELRVSHNELQQTLVTLSEDLSSTNMQLEKSRVLNATLENDLQKTQQEASNAFETMSVAGTWTSRYPTAGKSAYGSRRGGTSPTSSIIGGFDPSAPTGLRAGEPVGGGSGILPMVTAQRDRFKRKIGELESELQKQYQTVSSLRSEIASLQKDNLTLYEKTRYVSTYSRSTQPSTSGASYGANPNPSRIQVGVEATDADSRYRSAYEQNISPFAAFRSRESNRALKRMSLPEKAVWQVTRMVLATRTSRNLFAIYCLGLHMLVLIMLYWMGSAEVAQSVSHLGAASVAGAGAKIVAGNKGTVAAAGGGTAGASGHGTWELEGFEAGVS
nr:trna-dihydrouridine(16/17) synthase [nad(p)(+)] [Quercus suber]